MQALLLGLTALLPQAPGAPPGRPGGQPPNRGHSEPTTAAIAWFGTLESGLAEAKRSGKAILLQSAAPQCHGVPGMW